jgi:hypothetical protein
LVRFQNGGPFCVNIIAMSLEKGIQHGKEKRKQYQGRTSKKFDRSCRNHGNCGYCENNRLFSFRRLKFKAQQQIEEWLKE